MTEQELHERINKLLNKLAQKTVRVEERHKYYEMKNHVVDFGISTPDNLKWLQSSIGWCTKAVDSLADRLSFRGFDNEKYGVNEIFNQNNKDVLFDSVILEALISSCSFIYIGGSVDDGVTLQPVVAKDATGNIDQKTGLLTEAIMIMERNDYGLPTQYLYLIPEQSVLLDEKFNILTTYDHKIKHPLLVPVINRPDSERPFGRSRISRACMDYCSSAIRTIKRSEISAEFYSFPQKYINGIAEDVEIDKWKAAMSYVLTITESEDGNKPQIGQFTQQSMTPHIEQLKMFASLFAGEVGLTLEDIGFSTGNPASAEAIKASHNQMMLTAMKCQKKFSSAFVNVAYLSACLRDGYTYERSKFTEMKPIWEPLFTPDSSMLSGLGDGIIKINQSIPGYFDKNNVSVLTGIEASSGGETIDRYSARIANENTETV